MKGINLLKVFLCLSLCFLSINLIDVNALENDSETNKEGEDSFLVDDYDMTIEIDAPFSITEEDGSVVFFDNADDYNSYIDAFHTFKPAWRSYEKTVSTKVSEKKIKQAWIGYHPYTPNWSKASSYTLSKGKSYSLTGSYTYKGYAASITVKHNVNAAITYPANSKKYNRLGIKSDLVYRKFKHQVYSGGKVIKTYYSEGITKSGPLYIDVYYK